MSRLSISRFSLLHSQRVKRVKVHFVHLVVELCKEHGVLGMPRFHTCEVERLGFEVEVRHVQLHLFAHPSQRHGRAVHLKVEVLPEPTGDGAVGALPLLVVTQPNGVGVPSSQRDAGWPVQGRR